MYGIETPQQPQEVDKYLKFTALSLFLAFLYFPVGKICLIERGTFCNFENMQGYKLLALCIKETFEFFITLALSPIVIWAGSNPIQEVVLLSKSALALNSGIPLLYLLLRGFLKMRTPKHFDVNLCIFVTVLSFGLFFLIEEINIGFFFYFMSLLVSSFWAYKNRFL
jgi:hypothetical protein